MNKNDVVAAFDKIEQSFKEKIFSLPEEERPEFSSEAIYDCIVDLDHDMLVVALAHLLYVDTVMGAYKPLSSSEDITFE